MIPDPLTHCLIVGTGGNEFLKVIAGYTREAEKNVIQRTVVMVFPNCPGELGTALVKGSSGNNEAAQSYMGAAWIFIGQIFRQGLYIFGHSAGVISEGAIGCQGWEVAGRGVPGSKNRKE